MISAFLCLGGNLGDRFAILEKCREKIGAACGNIKASSSVYESPPWGSRSRHPYLNQVVEIRTTLKVEDLHKTLQKIEVSLGRKRKRKKNADRTCDIDILFYGKKIVEEKDLVIPHPRMEMRRFVLEPLNEIAPDLKHPVSRKKVSSLLRKCKDVGIKKYRQHKYVCIEGNIGSGKSTLARALAKKTGALLMPEQFRDNPFLPLFYKEPEKYALALEYSFFLDRYRQIKKNLVKDQRVVSDYCIHKCLWFASINLRSREYRLFKKEFNSIVDVLPKPDLIVHLRSDASLLLKNIRKRGRSYEDSIGKKYLKRIDQTYVKGMKNLGAEVLELRVKAYNTASLNKLTQVVKKDLGW